MNVYDCLWFFCVICGWGEGEGSDGDWSLKEKDR